MHTAIKNKLYILWPLLLLMPVTGGAQAQKCTTTGHAPATAFEVCGVLTFNQAAAPVCSNGRLHVPGCKSNGDNNPCWYRFTCYRQGTLGFVVTPAGPSYEDYDWQLFDITNHNPNDVFTDTTLFVSGNWSGGYTLTGTNNIATRNMACGSGPDDTATFSKMPILKQNHIYLLLISRANPQSAYGFALNFSGGTAVIADTTQAPARLRQAIPNCAGNKIAIAFSKKMQCSSLAANGSNFILSPQSATITSAVSINCDNTGMDSIELSLSNALPQGAYTLAAMQSDNGTGLVDNCGNEIPAGTKIMFTVQPSKPISMDSLAPPGCMPKTLKLVFKKGIYCNTIAANGSDFSISGQQAVSITSAVAKCNNGLANIITLGLSSPITQPGIYTVTLQSGNDGNTLADECSNAIPAGQQVSFTASGAVSAAFNLQVRQSCKGADTVMATINNNVNITSGYWLFDDNKTYNLPTVTRQYSNEANGNLKLVVNNDACSDSVTKSFTVPPKLKAAFAVSPKVCPKQPAIFNSTGAGIITAYLWFFGNGDSSRLPQPAALYPLAATDVTYRATLIVQNNAPCYDTAYGQVIVLADCSVAVPTAFTPNGDNINDYLYPVNAYAAKNILFRVFNRWGQLIFESKSIANRWDGTVKGIQQPTGVYAWLLSYTNATTNKQFVLRGTTVLLR